MNELAIYLSRSTAESFAAKPPRLLAPGSRRVRYRDSPLLEDGEFQIAILDGTTELLLPKQRAGADGDHASIEAEIRRLLACHVEGD
jgi:hypothetical protein